MTHRHTVIRTHAADKVRTGGWRKRGLKEKQEDEDEEEEGLHQVLKSLLFKTEESIVKWQAWRWKDWSADSNCLAGLELSWVWEKSGLTWKSHAGWDTGLENDINPHLQNHRSMLGLAGLSLRVSSCSFIPAFKPNMSGGNRWKWKQKVRTYSKLTACVHT